MKLHKIEKGRYVLFFGEYYNSTALRLEVSRQYNFGLGWQVTLKGEQEVQFSAYLFKLFSFWLTLEWKGFKYRNDDIDTGILWNPKEHSVHIELLSQKGMDSSKPAVIDKYWNYADWLLGRQIYSERENYRLGNRRLVLSLPEGDYKVELKHYTGYWHRPRLPFFKSVERVDVKPEKPVPIPGKGENSWDLDDDAIHESTEPVKGRTDEQIIADFKEHVLERRKRYGGSRDWQPSKA